MRLASNTISWLVCTVSHARVPLLGFTFKFPATLGCLFSYTTSPHCLSYLQYLLPKNMFSIFSVLVTSLRPRKASVPIASREDLVCTSMSFFAPPGRAGSNILARLKRLGAGATGLSYVVHTLTPSVYPRRNHTCRNKAHFPATRSVYYPISLPGTIARFLVFKPTDR